MILTLELSPEVEAMLKKMAEREGVSVTDTLQNFLKNVSQEGKSYFERNATFSPPEPKSPEEMDAETLAIIVISEMKERQAKNREAAVKAITAKNNLLVETERLERVVAELESKSLKAWKAWKDGNAEHARAFFREKIIQESPLPGLRKSLLEATETVERVKWTIRFDEERLRHILSDRTAGQMEIKYLQALAEISDATTQLFSAQEAVLMPEELERAFMTWVQTKQNNPEEDYRERRAWQEIIELQKRLDDLREKLQKE